MIPATPFDFAQRVDLLMYIVSERRVALYKVAKLPSGE